VPLRPVVDSAGSSERTIMNSLPPRLTDGSRGSPHRDREGGPPRPQADEVLEAVGDVRKDPKGLLLREAYDELGNLGDGRLGERAWGRFQAGPEEKVHLVLATHVGGDGFG
jgi:hypothetical protein